jgi:transcriptional regulator with XRE-family HTH domain
LKYNKLEDLQKKNKVSDRKVAEYLGMTGVGYRKMILNETCTVDTLERLAHYYHLSAKYFFDEEVEMLIKKQYAGDLENHDSNNDEHVQLYLCKNPACLKEIAYLKALVAAKEEALDLYRNPPKKETTDVDSVQLGESTKQRKIK